jgi:hypothetical protein
MEDVKEERDRLAETDSEEIEELLDDVAVAEFDEREEDVVVPVMNLNRVNLFGPPQISAAFPLHAILQPVEPSGAGPPPLLRTLSQ